MPSDKGRLDDLLARTLAHRAVLELLVAKTLSSDEERSVACEDAAHQLEALFSIPMTERAREAVERGLSELEEVFGLGDLRPDTPSEPGP